jgi:hypothetical protein
MDIAYPCVWAMLEEMAGVVQSLVNLHHAKHTVWTPWPQHRLLGCIASNFTYGSEVTLTFQWEVFLEIWIFLTPQLRTETMFIPTLGSHCWMCEKAMECRVVYIGRRRRLGGGLFVPWEGKHNSTQRKHILLLGDYCVVSHPFFKENRMHLICVPGSQFHTYDRQMSVISQDIAQNIHKRFINFFYTHEVDTMVFTRTTITMMMRLHLYLPRASDSLIACLRTPRSLWSTPLWGSSLNSVSKDGYTYDWYSARPQKQPESKLSPSLSSLIMWGSRPLLTLSTADQSVLHSAVVAHFHHSLRKTSEELWTQPCMCWLGTIPHFRGVIA